ncbi:hypothetical protein [Nostoc sp. LPT]|uniref:hypothetical protein n=1 Tax=Nostoc sp. LPT TaxID=2815387 RepID=UPI001D582266|nr:hypothetical protein [Nostoc sp. LPT]MBN4003449.1 hypothetical protein [Nostoc sp. LPT]
MLNQPQTVTLRAFLTALVELDSPLPTALQQEINKVGEMLVNTSNKDNALNRLIELAENESLRASYHNARMKIQTQYKTQELNRYEDESKQKQPTTTPEHFVKNIAIPIFTASDSSTEAKKHKLEIIAKKP